MKRLLIRISALTAVVVLGAITIAQAQRSLGLPDSGGETSEVAAEPGEIPDASMASTLSMPEVEYRGQIADDEADDDIPDAHQLGALHSPRSTDRYAETDAPSEVRDPFGLHRAETTPPVEDSEAMDDDRLPAYEPTPVSERGYGEPPPARRPTELARDDSSVDSEPWDTLPSSSAARYELSAAAANDRYATNHPLAAQAVDEADGADATRFDGELTGDRRVAPPANDPFETPRPQANVLRHTSSETTSPAAQLADPYVERRQVAHDDDLTERPFEQSRRASVQDSEGTGRPGAQALEGMQIPTLSVQKIMPAEVQVGKTASFKIEVRNIGQVTAHEVMLSDEVPQGARLVAANPPATQASSGQMTWSLGSLRPGDESIVEIQFVPTREGELGSVATLHFAASASARTLATQPQLTLDVRTESRSMIGEQVVVQIDVKNVGSGQARNVVVDQPLPQGLQHPAGQALEYEVGDLAPGESRQIELVLDATQPGQTANLMQLRCEGEVHAEQAWNLEVVAPALQVAIEGSKRRFLEREATYTIAVANPGTAPARDIELVTYLPRGMKFVEANNYGQFDPEQNAVYWSLEELPMNEKGHVTLTAIPTEPGELRLQIHGTAERGLSAQQEETILVEGVAAILFQVVDLADPIEVGGETTYEIQVLNQGTSSANNIRLRAILPEELKPLSAEGPTRHLLDGQMVTFDPLTGLAPKAETIYRIKARALHAGDSRIRVQLLTDELQTPVTKEESTRVFAAE